MPPVRDEVEQCLEINILVPPDFHRFLKRLGNLGFRNSILTVKQLDDFRETPPTNPAQENVFH